MNWINPDGERKREAEARTRPGGGALVEKIHHKDLKERIEGTGKGLVWFGRE
jgi:hypothetical protein